MLKMSVQTQTSCESKLDCLLCCCKTAPVPGVRDSQHLQEAMLCCEVTICICRREDKLCGKAGWQ